MHLDRLLHRQIAAAHAGQLFAAAQRSFASAALRTVDPPTSPIRSEPPVHHS
jgi:hypothetical protein